MKKLLLFPVLVLFALISASDAGAVVRVVDSTDTSQFDFPVISATVDTISGEGDPNPGDYLLLFCSTESEPFNNNFFNLATPGDWTQLGNSQCGDDGCVKGIWGRFTNTTSNEPTTCSWGTGESVFVGGTLRYAEVDVNNPVIDTVCQSGSGSQATAPSIITEPGSQVLRAFTYSNPTIGYRCPLIADEVTFGFIFACSAGEINNVTLDVTSTADLEGGATGEIVLSLPEPQMDWRACTIALRMPIRNIPTMSEWGLLAVAGFMGIAGALYIRKINTEAN